MGIFKSSNGRSDIGTHSREIQLIAPSRTQKSACENENQNDWKQKADTQSLIDLVGRAQEQADIDLSFNLTE